MTSSPWVDRCESLKIGLQRRESGLVKAHEHVVQCQLSIKHSGTSDTQSGSDCIRRGLGRKRGERLG